MINLEAEIKKYVESKRSIWSDRTLPVTLSVLRSLAVCWSNPDANFKQLIKAGKTKYTIKTYFLVASKFEEERFGTVTYRTFLNKNKSTFKNCYKDKVKLVKPEQYKEFLKMYRNTNADMYNLLVLMGTAGLRISEALQAKWEDLQDGFLKVIGKGNKQRVVPFDGKSLIQVDVKKKSSIIGTVAYRFFFERDIKTFTPHDFRAYYATFVANHPELSIKDAALLLGHNSILTTSRYVRSDLNRIKKVLSKV